MKILKEKSTERSGNDCWIQATVVLLEFSDTNFLVVSTEQFLGGWFSLDYPNWFSSARLDIDSSLYNKMQELLQEAK